MLVHLDFLTWIITPPPADEITVYGFGIRAAANVFAGVSVSTLRLGGASKVRNAWNKFRLSSSSLAILRLAAVLPFCLRHSVSSDLVYTSPNFKHQRGRRVTTSLKL